MDNRVEILEQKIRASVQIPASLVNNVFLTTTGLGGVFLNYRSNTINRLAVENSRVQLTIMFNTTNERGGYAGEEVGFEVTRAWNIKPPRGIKAKKHYTEIVNKVNKWLRENERLLYSAIENK